MTSKKYLQRALFIIPLFLVAGVTRADTQTPKSDSAITKEVHEKLDQDPTLLGKDNVHVNTKNGVVNLSGLVDTRVERSKIVAETSSIPGVKSVNNGIAIDNNS